MSTKVSIVLGTNAMEITPDPSSTHASELIPKSSILGVFPVGVQYKPVTAEDAPWWIYPYETMTIIEVTLFDERRLNIELQDVLNQATWNLGTLAAQKVAIADIKTWLNT